MGDRWVDFVCWCEPPETVWLLLLLSCRVISIGFWVSKSVHLFRYQESVHELVRIIASLPSIPRTLEFLNGTRMLQNYSTMTTLCLAQAQYPDSVFIGCMDGNMSVFSMQDSSLDTITVTKNNSELSFSLGHYQEHQCLVASADGTIKLYYYIGFYILLTRSGSTAEKRFC